MRVVLDTHVWFWAKMEPHRLSPKAAAAIKEATERFISPVSFFEVGQKVRLGKWDVAAPLLEEGPDDLSTSGFREAVLDIGVAVRAAELDWDNRDPFDRLICATAIDADATVISADRRFGEVPGLRVIW